MPDIPELIDGINELIKLMFGGNPPWFLLPTIAWTIAIGLLLAGLAFILGQLKNIWLEFLKPLFHNPVQKLKLIRRQQFSDYLESEIRRLNTLEAWSDYRFTELEAEVEAEGKRVWLGLFRLPGFFRTGLRYEKSLSTAIERSDERLILLEGDPGSGKSVALRHVTIRMSRRASKSRNINSLIPIYINLKEIERSPGEEVNREYIEKFILKTLNRVNDRDVEEFLDANFKEGLKNGSWLFLFDSFDEIPDILASTEADEVINLYAGAIRDFLHGMNRCRGVIASREYKGPRRLGWPTFQIIRLTKNRRDQLIKQSGLPYETQVKIKGSLSIASSEFITMASNPMFLSLLCDYFRDNKEIPFPQHTHAVYENYVERRLSRDENRIVRRFGKTSNEVRLAAEKMAYCMTVDANLGLSPSREKLCEAAKRLDLEIEEFDLMADALEFVKLARSDTMREVGESRSFTFAHRRFQEYFATSVVLRDPDKVSPEELLTNARWRETTVVILQTQHFEVSRRILDLSNFLLKSFTTEMNLDNEIKPITKVETRMIVGKGFISFFSSSISSFFSIFYFLIHDLRGSIKLFQKHENKSFFEFPRSMIWPKYLLHILSILQDGLIGKKQVIPRDLQETVDQILLYYSKGTIFDKKWALEVAGTASEDTLENLILNGFKSRSFWLKNIAYQQVANLGKVSDSISRFIRIEIIRIVIGKNRFFHRHEIYAQITRIENCQVYVNIWRLMSLFPFIEAFFVIIATLTFLRINLILNFTRIFPIYFIILVLLFPLIRWFISFPEYYQELANRMVMVLPPIIILEITILNILYQISPIYAFAELSTISNQQEFSLLLFILFFSITWAFSAIEVLRFGRLAHPIWWPFYPFVMAIGFILIIPIFGLIFIPILILITVRFFLSGLTFISTHQDHPLINLRIYLISFILSFIISFTVAHIIANRMESSFNRLNLILLALAFSILFLLISPSILMFINDLIEYIRWRRLPKGRMNFHEFVHLLDKFMSSIVRTRIIEIVRERQLLLINPDTEKHLFDLILMIEGVIKSFDNNNEVYQIALRRVAKLNKDLAQIMVSCKNQSTYFYWDRLQLDEFYRLLEQVRQLNG